MRVVGTVATAALAFSSISILVGCAGDRDAMMTSSSLVPQSLAPSSSNNMQANGAPSRNVAAQNGASTAASTAAISTAISTAAISPPRCTDARDVRVMSFNLRCPFILDGPNFWPFRKGLALETIRRFEPDILGTQECVASQADFLRQRLADYEFLGAGRNDGKTRGEMCALFVRKDKFQVVESGHFWLSEHPQTPGSKSWGSFVPRMVTWAKLRRRCDGQVICAFNTHFDAWGGRARVESAGLLRQRAAEIAGAAPIVITGDFNDEPGSATYRTLVTGRNGSTDRALTDALRAAQPGGDQHREGTRHDFWGGHGGPRIDWILTGGPIQVMWAQIDRNRSGGRYPSDHFPMEAVVRVNGPAAPAIAKSE